CGGGDAAIPTTPLAGTIEGKAFKAASAFALTGDTPDDRFVVVRDKAATCADTSAAGDGDLLVTFFAPWNDGSQEPVGADHAITLEKAPEKVLATSGELDVLHAPKGIGATAVMLLRADAEDGQSKVEGKIEATVCQ